ncbi:MAG: J domain-containing protein [Salinibacterium sp.]|nr:MAG: J domain-containing protein [Salinibacterium sp.]
MTTPPKEAYPLAWPSGQPRTPSARRKVSQFKVQFGQARDELLAELDRLGARKVIVSTDVPLRRDGLPYADGDPVDPGDRRLLRAQGQALRDRLRHVHAPALQHPGDRRHRRGAPHDRAPCLDADDGAAFTGFAALPPARAAEPSWWEVLAVPCDASLDQVKTRYRELARLNHPDTGGTDAEMARINRAYERACQDRG